MTTRAQSTPVAAARPSACQLHHYYRQTAGFRQRGCLPGAAALLGLLGLLLLTTSASAQWFSGTTVLSSAYGGATDSDAVDGATLIVTNGGSLLAEQLTVAPTNAATLKLVGGGAVTVQTLLATNVVLGGAANSTFTFSGGTLNTSNAATAVAASILVASNAYFSINGNWNMNGGTNYTASVQASGVWGVAEVGNGVNNVTVTVNSNAIWSLGNPAISPTNLSLAVGAGAATNNLLLITNGGQFLCGPFYLASTVANVGGISSSGNGVIVTGTNAAGSSTWNMGVNPLVIGGNSGTSLGSYNFLKLDQDGVFTNSGGTVRMYGFNNSLIVTNGARCCLNGNLSPGTGGSNNVVLVGGFDSAGNPATLALLGYNSVQIGGSGGATTGTNSGLWVGQGGYVTNSGYLTVGCATNASGNFLAITNGGQVASYGNTAKIGGYTNANNNYITIGGAFGTTNATWIQGGANFGTVNIGAINACTNNYLTLFTGGVLKVSQVILGGVSNNLYFNGGTLSAFGNGTLITTNAGAGAVNCFAYVQSGGAIINSGAYNVTNGVPLTQDPNSPGGSLTKLGSGSLTLNTSNSFTGGVFLTNGGTLYVNNAYALGATNGNVFTYTNSTMEIGLNGDPGITVTGVTNNLLNATSVMKGSTSGSGGNVWAGPVVLGADKTTISTEAGGNLTILGNITAKAGGDFGVVFAPDAGGTITLSGTGNAWNNGGGTYSAINGSGTVVLGVNNALATNTYVQGGGGTLDLHGYNQACTGLYAWNAGSVIENNGASPAILTVTAATGNTWIGTLKDGSSSLALVKTGAGTQILTNANTYSGATTISGGTLALAGYGSIANTILISITNGAVFDISGLTNAFALQSSQTLSNNAASTGFLAGNLNASAGTNSVSYTNGTPAFAVTNGTLTLASGTVFHVNNTGPALAAGSYLIISNITAGSAGSIGGSAPSTVTVNGGGIASGTTAALQIVSAGLDLVVTSSSSVNTNAATANFKAVAGSGTLQFSWASDHEGWQLYTNAVSLAATSSWFPVPGSSNVTSETITINPATPKVFFQLRYP